MAKTAALFVALISVAATCAYAQFPIPKSYVGFVYGPQPGELPVVLEAFYDLTCPSCRAAWPGVKAAKEFYGRRLRLVLHPFVLPFHHNSNLAAKALHAVASVNVSLAFDWLEAVFANQDDFSTEATWQTTPQAVTTRFAELAESALGIPQAKFLAAFEKTPVEIATRVSFKYGCSRAIVQTPSYFVNGVPVRGADDSWTLDDWQQLIDPLAVPGQQGSQAFTGFEAQ